MCHLLDFSAMQDGAQCLGFEVALIATKNVPDNTGKKHKSFGVVCGALSKESQICLVQLCPKNKNQEKLHSSQLFSFQTINIQE